MGFEPHPFHFYPTLFIKAPFLQKILIPTLFGNIVNYKGQRKWIHSFLLPPASDFAPAPDISLFFVNSLFSIFTFGSVGKSPKCTSNIQSSTKTNHIICDFFFLDIIKKIQWQKKPKTNHDSARRLAPILQCYIYYCLTILTGNHIHHVHQVPDEL